MTTDTESRSLPSILVVDDDAAIRLIARITLEQSGFSVLEAEDGLQALSLLRERKTDLVLLDVILPGLDGIGVCRELRNMKGGERIPVLMITGLDDFESISRSYDAGATDFMTKPINWTILAHRLMYMLRASETFNELVKSEAKNRALLDAMPDAMFQISRSGIFIDFKVALEIELLVEPEEVLGRSVKDVLHEPLATRMIAMVEKALNTGEPQLFEYQTSRNGSDRYLEVRVASCGGDEVLALIRDITERKHAENSMRFLAYHDALTRLPNINLFRDLLTRALVSAGHSGRYVAVLFLDLDRFKLINDTFGHKIGDILLQAVADRILGGMRRSDIVAHIGNDKINDMVARLGGDEFTLMLPEVRQPEDVAKVSHRVLEELSGPFVIDSHELNITASIGIALFPDDGDNIDLLLRNADTAMYHAKISGRNNYQFFDESMNLHMKERLSIEEGIRNALRDGKFLLYYLPRYEMGSGRITGVEALLRWHQQEIGSIPVEQVISIASDINLIDLLGEWILRAACRQAAEWQKAGLNARISVNLSVYEFKRDALVDYIENLAAETGFDPRLMEFEITESVIMQDVEITTAILSRFAALGIRISIDDFGTGYSSLRFLSRFPIDSLKIAQTLTKDLGRDDHSSEVVKAIIALAHSLKFKVIAEGVETGAHYSFLSEQGCDECQGFLYSPPISAEDMTRLLMEQDRKSRLTS